MQLIRFPLERVVDINEQILKTEAGFKVAPDLGVGVLEIGREC